MDNSDYLRYRQILKGQRLPLAFVDLENFDANISYVAATQKDTGKTVRVASKSLRCIDLMSRIFSRGGSVYKGILAFTVEEAAFLISHGFDDIIVAYPTVQPSDMEIMAELAKDGRRVALVADSLEHLRAMSAAGEQTGATLEACLEVDMSWRPLRSSLHLGVRRSPLRNIPETLALAEAARSLKGVRIGALMGYEGQIASLNDELPGAWFKSKLYRLLKKLSIVEFTARRDSIVAALSRAGAELSTVNGGGSGSLISSGQDPYLTEVTAGSAFYAPGLFHHFREVKFRPSAFFALQVARIPAPGMVTCQGGGYTASGAAGRDKLPIPMLPVGLTLLPLEGAGEVQTPLLLPPDCPELRPGDPVIFQHAKAGELAERFTELYLIEKGKVVDKVKTYRGEGMAFL
ncbi:MAG: alanine racemase [Smithellaceae bacterium]|nr:alanine racemase [Smithellaceae bacterium]